MLQMFKDAMTPSSSPSRLARAFSRLGWIGFWLQIVVGSIPVVMMIYVFAFARNAAAAPSGGLPLVGYLTVASLLMLAFTTFWSYRYTRIAKRIADPQESLSQLAPDRAAWTGAAASALGILFSMVVMLIEVASLLFYFLKAPQAGVPVIQTTGGGPASWVSAVDVMSLMALVLTVFAEVIVLIFSLWLAFRASIATGALTDEIGSAGSE